VETQAQVKARLLGAAEDAFDTFERLVRDIPLGRRYGGWSIRELIGHLASWTAEAARGILEDMAGFPFSREARDAFNDRARAQVSKESDAELLQRYAAARTTFLATVMAAPPSALARGAVGGEWARGIVEHYMGHIAMLEGEPAA
jgi:Mycothiol maleylpyruvate isomerase N-terminal domain